MAYGLTADMDEARDITQEAFCRAWKSWQHLSEYDNPITWVRRVAINLVYSRWRHLRAARTHLHRHRAGDTVTAPPNLDHVALVAALRQLPRDQCIALVLHHMLDLPVAEVAKVLDANVGQVKMWLHRGRHTLAAELGEGFTSATLNDTATAERTIKRRKGRQRTGKVAVGAAAVLLTILAATTVADVVRPMGRLPHPGNGSAVRPLRPAQPSVLMRPAVVTLSWQGDKLTVRWTDPSDGYAQPILMGGLKDAAMSEMAKPVKGDTQAIIADLSPAQTYCLTVFLAYTDNNLLASGRVCTQPSATRNFHRFEDLIFM